MLKQEVPYSAKFWRRKTLANLANRIAFANILSRQNHLYCSSTWINFVRTSNELAKIGKNVHRPVK